MTDSEAERIAGLGTIGKKLLGRGLSALARHWLSIGLVLSWQHDADMYRRHVDGRMDASLPPKLNGPTLRPCSMTSHRLPQAFKLTARSP